ncbi:MAG TPA: crosslink repair DNA glycosylase YcaQ family protein [Gaiellaceae bacterium]|jgi:hypothetical protein|nr:crosslink repair DNA glycosylase YcaQ family protein [Gaiellaceae bacterium]
MKLTWEQVRARRLARNRLTEPAPSVVDAVRATCGIQAQLQSAAELGTRLRVDGPADVRAALWEERTLVRTWTMRGTLHLHPSDEFGLWTSAARATHRGDPPPAGLLDAFEAVLADGVPRLRAELAEEVAARVGDWAREPLASGWAYLTGYAADAGILCNGPPRGAKVTFVHARSWLGSFGEWEEHEALREGLRRYVRAYGPVRDARFVGARLDTIREELEPVDVDGKRGWILAGDHDFPDPVPSVFLLPQYDAYVIGFRERDHLLWGAAKELFWDTRWLKEGRYESPVVFRNAVVDGVIAGKWSTEGVELAEPLDPPHAELLEAELARVRTLSG